MNELDKALEEWKNARYEFKRAVEVLLAAADSLEKTVSHE